MSHPKYAAPPMSRRVPLWRLQRSDSILKKKKAKRRHYGSSRAGACVGDGVMS